MDLVERTQAFAESVRRKDAAALTNFIAEDARFEIDGVGSWRKPQLEGALPMLAMTHDLKLDIQDVVQKRNVTFLAWRLVVGPFLNAKGAAVLSWNQEGKIVHANVQWKKDE